MRLLALLSLAALTSCSPADQPTEAATLPTSVESPERLELPGAFADALAQAGVEGRALDASGQAWAIAEVASDSGSFLVQWADLDSVWVEQVLGDVTEAGAPGLYHPSAPSPSFGLLDPSEVVATAWDRDALSVMNGAFFETPGQPTSEIAFPIATGGRVVTGGRSPYGPGRPSAGGKRWGRPLRVLGLDTLGTVARITDYDRRSGAPLGQSGFADALVSYAPDAHPTRIATRFHVLGTLQTPPEADGTEAGRAVAHVLIAVTSDGQTRIGAATSLLSRLGVEPGAQIALDGGASVLVWTPRAGTLHSPAPIRGRPQPLPHYLVFRRR